MQTYLPKDHERSESARRCDTITNISAAAACFWMRILARSCFEARGLALLLGPMCFRGLLPVADVHWPAQRARKQREEGKARKAERQKKSLVVQKITNPATLKRMMKSKKDRKKLIASDIV